MTVSAPPPQPVETIMAQALKDLEQSLQLAVNHHQCGQLEEAETFYRSILQIPAESPEGQSPSWRSGNAGKASECRAAALCRSTGSQVRAAAAILAKLSELSSINPLMPVSDPGTV